MSNEFMYGHTDAMELTPSVASLASSQARNMSFNGNGKSNSSNQKNRI